MSLSPKDDPRTWLVPGPRAFPRPPLQARLLYYDLTKSQRALLRAFHENAPEGALWEASPETLAETSGLSPKHIWNLIHGWTRNGHHTAGFLELHILEERRKGRRAPKPKPAAYQFHEWALRLRPELVARLEPGVQLNLLGARCGEPTTAGAQPSVTVSDGHRKQLPQPPVTVSDDSKATTSTTRERERFNNSNPPSLSIRKETAYVTSNGQNVSRAAEEMVERLLKRWPNHKKDAAQIIMYRDDIRALIAECGHGRVQAAEEASRTRCSFLPEPAELRALLAAPEQFRQWHDPECRDCHGCGWREVVVSSDKKHIDLYGKPMMRVARRCYCQPSTGKPEGSKEPLPIMAEIRV